MEERIREVLASWGHRVDVPSIHPTSSGFTAVVLIHRPEDRAPRALITWLSPQGDLLGSMDISEWDPSLPARGSWEPSSPNPPLAEQKLPSPPDLLPPKEKDYPEQEDLTETQAALLNLLRDRPRGLRISQVVLKMGLSHRKARDLVDHLCQKGLARTTASGLIITGGSQKAR